MVSSVDLPPLVGQSPAFLELMERVSLAAPQDRPLILIGERGTGKEQIGMRLHFLSRRWQGSFVQLNCAALPDTLLETELFGHEAGAFTGAGSRRIGRFEMADGGTLFLDEIANATLKAQEKILRVIEYGTFERVGGNETLKVDVRVIGATNVDLPSEADAGRFRHDLLDRMSFDVLTIPQLRFRHGDIPLLAQHFGHQMGGDIGWEDFPGFTKELEKELNTYAWPGNVRELKNVIERAVYLHDDSDSPINDATFDPFKSPFRPPIRQLNEPTSSDAAPARINAPSPSEPVDLKDAVESFEKQLITDALEINKHNQKATAAHLGLGYHQLRNRLKKFEIT